MSQARAGEAAEAQALAHLQKNNLTLLAKNYRCRYGEIDLIMRDGAHVVFVEVRQRKKHAHAAVSIDLHKQQRLAATAAHYLGSRGDSLGCRFDVVLIDENARLRWLKNAFETDGN